MIKLKFIIFIFFTSLLLPLSYISAGTILSSHKYAWSNNVGYINFEDVIVNDSALSGYAWSANKGFIKFDPAEGGVVNDGAGNLSGSAWGEGLGWIDFDNVSIDGNGVFSGTAEGDLVGTINFDCPNYCDVETDWRSTVTPAPSPTTGSGGGGSSGSSSGRPLFPDTGAIPINLAETAIVVINVLENESAKKENAEIATENSPLFDVISEPANARVDTISAGLTARVAPGEFLPISVKLSNFGGGRRVDVLVVYSIAGSKGEEIYQSKETVAVETTANFVKTIQIPYDTKPGTYTAKTSIFYEGQLVPATTQFPFTVERKILGLFQSDFYLYGGIIVIISIVASVLGRMLVKRRRTGRTSPFDYSNIPNSERTFYEILSDTIMQMRGRVGDDALHIALRIPGLKIDAETGRVLALTEPPAKIIATLVSEYENLLGRKVSFSFRREKTGI